MYEEVWSVFFHFVIKIMFEDFFFILKELIKISFVKLYVKDLDYD
jgi:hypothetical protein